MRSSESDILSTQKPKVFISHSHKDQIYARKILAWLEKVGFAPWASFEECSDLYRNQIDNALLECDVFLLIATKASFDSIEVRREITTAGSLNKKISYYKLDGSSHLREGFLTLLSEKQYVQASKENLELDKLAINLFDTLDGNKNERIRQHRERLIGDYLIVEKENYAKWKEKLWVLRLDSNNNPRKLSSFDKGMLQQEADRLGLIVSIDDEDQAFSLNKLSFTNELRSMVAKRRITKTMLNQIEKKRLECSVSKNLASSILSDRLCKIDYLRHIKILKSADKADHWFVSQVRSMQLTKTVECSLESVNADVTLNTSFDRPQEIELFTFKHDACPLERFVNGSCDLAMNVISLLRQENRIVFIGLQESRPFTFQLSSSFEISSRPGWVALVHNGNESYISIKVADRDDYEPMIRFLKPKHDQLNYFTSRHDCQESKTRSHSVANEEKRVDVALAKGDTSENSHNSESDEWLGCLVLTVIAVPIIMSIPSLAKSFLEFIFYHH